MGWAPPGGSGPGSPRRWPAGGGYRTQGGSDVAGRRDLADGRTVPRSPTEGHRCVQGAFLHRGGAAVDAPTTADLAGRCGNAGTDPKGGLWVRTGWSHSLRAANAYRRVDEIAFRQ
jgi:hypothetical protein